MNDNFAPKTYGIIHNSARTKLIEKIEKKAARVFAFPALVASQVYSAENVETLTNLRDDYDWIVLTDVFAVEFVLKILENAAIDKFILDEIGVVACGEAVAERLRHVQIHADIILTSDQSNANYAAILNYIGETEIGAARFLVAGESSYAFPLSQKLTNIGAKITQIAVYALSNNDKQETARLKTLLRGGAVDEFIFGSPEDVIYLKKYAEPETISDILTEISAVGLDEITVQTLRENNLESSKFLL